ncbi:hypothetical protein OAP63_14380 [Vibrio sp.]|nr:hypothetical protein [Vibrio sp.]
MSTQESSLNDYLSEKQKYQREYYRKNKEEICAKKRDQYTPKTERKKRVAKVKPTRKTRSTTPRTVSAPGRATQPVKKVDKIQQKTRNKIEDLLLAQELGISVEELN